MNIQTIKNDQGLVLVRVSGRIDPVSSGQLEEELNKIISGGSIRLVLNLKEVNFISSSGLRVFLTVLKKVKAQKGDVKLCEMDANVEKIFRIAGFVSLFDIVATEQEAVQKFS